VFLDSLILRDEEKVKGAGSFFFSLFTTFVFLFLLFYFYFQITSQNIILQNNKTSSHQLVSKTSGILMHNYQVKRQERTRNIFNNIFE